MKSIGRQLITSSSRAFGGQKSRTAQPARLLGAVASRRTVAAANIAVLGARRGAHSAANSASQRKSSHFLLAAGLVAAAGAASTSAVVLAGEAQPDYAEIRKEIAEIIDSNESWGPTFVRLAWHASGTYDKKTRTGGSHGGTMRFRPESTDPANAGLGLARDILEPIKKKYPGISYGDLWTLAGVVAIEEMGGPAIKWRPGRTDTSDESRVPPNGRLPGADKGADKDTAQHMRDVFYRMGFNDKEIVALLGAHAVGRCHEDRSGYWGPWTRAETTFSNQYFKELLENKWTVKKTHFGKPWTGPRQYEDPSGDLMMLPADLVLLSDEGFRKHVEVFAKSEDAWHEAFSQAFEKLLELGYSRKPWYQFW